MGFLAHYKNAVQAGATPTVRKKLFEWQTQHLPMKVFVAEMNQLVEEGKLAPNAAATFLAQYKKTVPADATGPNEEAKPVEDDKAKTDKANEDKANEDKAKEDKSKADKAAAEKAAAVKTAEEKAKEEAKKKETDAKTKKEAEANAGKAAASTRPTEEAKPVEEDKAKSDKGDGSTNATASEGATPAVDGEVDFSVLKGRKNVRMHNTVRRKIFELQTQNLPVKGFVAELKGLVEEGKLAPVDAATFLAHYKNAAEAGARPTVRKKLIEMQMNHLPMKVFVAELNQLVEEGKLAPNAAATFLAQYRKTVPADATGPTEEAKPVEDDKAKTDKANEDKANEDKAKEDKSKADKAAAEKAAAVKTAEEKAKEEAKKKETLKLKKKPKRTPAKQLHLLDQLRKQNPLRKIRPKPIRAMAAQMLPHPRGQHQRLMEKWTFRS